MKKYYDDDLISNIRFEISNFNFDKASILLDSYERMYPEDALGKIYRAEYLRRIGKTEDALYYIENLHKRFHSGYVAIIYYQVYGAILEDTDNMEDAEKMYKKSFEISNKDGVSTVQTANFYIRNHEYEKAEKVLNHSSNKSKDIVVLTRGKLLYREGKYEDAIKVLDTLNDNLLDKNSLNFKRYFLGLSYYDINDYDKAFKLLSKVRLKKKGYMANKNYTLAEISLKNKKYIDALNYINEYLNYDGYEEKIKFYLFRIYIKLGRREDARKVAENIGEKDPNKLNDLGHLEYAEGNYDEAEEYFSKSLSHSKVGFENSVVGILLCYARKGEFENLKNAIYYLEDDIDKERYGQTIMLLKAYVSKIYNENVDYNKLVYSEKQVYRYDLEKAKKHIMYHHEDTFNESNIDDMIEKVQSKINENNLYNRVFFDKYNVDIDGIAYSVVTLPDSDKIITMYKDDTKETLDDENVKVLKKESQIEKFRRRYGNKY